MTPLRFVTVHAIAALSGGALGFATGWLVWAEGTRHVQTQQVAEATNRLGGEVPGPSGRRVPTVVADTTASPQHRELLELEERLRGGEPWGADISETAQPAAVSAIVSAHRDHTWDSVEVDCDRYPCILVARSRRGGDGRYASVYDHLPERRSIGIPDPDDADSELILSAIVDGDSQDPAVLVRLMDVAWRYIPPPKPGTPP